MLRIAIPALALALALPARAATSAPGAVTMAPDGKVVIAVPPCADLVAGAEYVPGVDGDGQAVAPADLPRDAPAVKLDDPPIVLDAHLARRFGVPQTGGANAKAILGTVTVRDGRAYLNGQPLAPDASAAMIAACRAAKP